MSLRSLFRPSFVAILTSVMLGQGLAASAADGGPQVAPALVYETSDGQRYFAAGLSLDGYESAAATHDVVVLFDTSASQVGIYRDDAFEALQTMLAELGDNVRVKLVAVDVNAIDLTADFVSADSQEMASALSQLQNREPLGATDLVGALDAATFALSGDNPRAVIYIGDGNSQGNFMLTEEYAETIQKLTDAQVSVSSYAIGPGRDIQLMAALANQTGGALFVDADNVSGQQAGRELAVMATDTVVWPAAVDSSGVAEMLPSGLLPLRTGRETIVLGTLDENGPYSISLSGTLGGQPVQMTWDVAPQQTPDEKTFLADLVRQARLDDGISLPTVGRAGLLEAERVIQNNAEGLAAVGERALSSGDAATAQRLADEALARDPGNPRASAVRAASAQVPVGEEPLLLTAQVDTSTAAVDQDGALLDQYLQEDGQFLTPYEEGRQRRAAIIEVEVEVALENARARMDTDPAGVRQDLKILLEGVQRAPDLPGDVRSQLADRLLSAIHESERVQRVVELRTQERLADAAVIAERERLLDEVARNEQKVLSLMDQFNALLDEHQYAVAEDAAVYARDIAPNNPAPALAIEYSRLADTHYRTAQLIAAKQRGFIDNLYEVGRSSIPFPGSPPLVYPDAEWWHAMSQRREKYASIDLARPDSAEEKIYEELDKPTEFSFFETSLQDVVVYLEGEHDINIELDARALDDVGLGTDVPITRELRGITLRSALRLMLREYDLTYTVRDEVLLITTEDEVENDLSTRVYPVADLVLPIQSGSLVNPFALGGGGFGGGAAGIGGGGAAVGNNNFGGGLGGGLGGGVGGGGIFAVEDPLILGGNAESNTETKPASQPVAPTQVVQPAVVPATAEVGSITIDVAGGQTLTSAWDAYFQENEADPAAVRETARQLMAAEDFTGASTMIRSALRCGQPQAWMYQALGLALAAQDAPAEEIERAFMSALDITNNPEELLFIARYFDSMGLEKRALAIYRDLAQTNPTETEPYLSGLRIAQRIDDLDALQWACLGVLRQAWPSNQQSIETDALRIASDTLARLREQGRDEDAINFNRQLNEALARDVVIRVSWTGDADIDLLVLEPSGTVCSYQNPRTTSGGVLLGDSYTRNESGAADGYSEVYVCPQGFAGEYRIMLRPVWGRPTAGKVSVEVIRHYRSPNMDRSREMISLEERESYGNFQLDEGRRQAPLADEQIAQAVQSHTEISEAVSRAVLLQQLNTVSDSMAVRDFELARRRAEASGVPNPFFRNQAVGFQPQITTLPSGVNMTATAVISADRKYVRITAVPLFSVAGPGTTFNFATGMSGSDDDNGGDNTGDNTGDDTGGGAGA